MAKGSFTTLDADLDVHQSLQQQPELGWEQLQELFDSPADAIKAYLNDTLLSELNTGQGSNKIAHSSANITADNVEEALEEVRDIAVQAQAGEITDNSITDLKLATDNKVGSLTTLTTTDKSSTVAAINELDSDLGDAETDITNLTGRVTEVEISKTSWVTTGSANAQAVDTNNRFDATEEKFKFTIMPIASNLGAMTLNVDSNGLKAVKKFDVDTDTYVDVEAGDIKKNNPIDVTWLLGLDFFVVAPRKGFRIKSYSTDKVTMSSLTQNITIDAVTVANTVVNIRMNGSTGANDGSKGVKGVVTSPTNLQLTTAEIGGELVYEVIEFADFKSIQSDLETSISNSGTVVTLSNEVDPNKCLLYYAYRNTNTGFLTRYLNAIGEIINSTSIRFENGINDTNNEVQWYLVESR